MAKLVSIPGPCGSIEARVNTSSLSDCAVILCHPWTRMGGCMDNNVVFALEKTLSPKYVTVAVNFRGAGNSSGWTSLTGMGEVDDLKSVCSYSTSGQLGIEVKRLVLIGYSFGSLVAGGAVLSVPNVQAYCGISYPAGVAMFLSLWKTSELRKPLMTSPSIPKMMVMGDCDNFTSVSRWEHLCNSCNVDEKQVFPGVDHFWFGKEKAMCAQIMAWLDKVLNVEKQ